MITITREFTATQVGTIDTAALAITDASGTGFVRAPRVVVFYKPAGTAYTVGSGLLELRDANGTTLAAFPAAGFLDQAGAKSRLVVLGGQAYTGGSTALSLYSSDTITAGADSPVLRVRVFADDYPLVF